MLRGNALAKVDAKGRLKVPSAYRAIIEPNYGREFFVTSLRGESVRVYPMDVWTAIESKMAQVSSLNPAMNRFRKRVHYFGQPATMDSQGRLLIHPLLRERADVTGEVAVLGQLDFLEVWNRAAFEQGLVSDPLTDDDLAELSKLGI